MILFPFVDLRKCAAQTKLFWIACINTGNKWRGKIVHANFAVGKTVLAGADILPEQYVKPRGFYVLLSVDGSVWILV